MSEKTAIREVTALRPVGQAVQVKESQEDVIDLGEIFFSLLHGWKELLLCLLVGAALAGAYHTYSVKPSYQASTDLFITSTDSVISLQDLQIGAALTSDYQNIITSRQVLNKVISDLQLNIDYKALNKLITVTNPSGTHIVHTTVTTSDLALSRDIANDLLLVSIDQIYQIVGTSRPTIIDYSEARAVEDVTPGIIRYMAIGAVLGMLLMAAVIVVKYVMNSTIKSVDDVERYLQLPMLAAVPFYQE